jgi:alpha-amylase
MATRAAIYLVAHQPRRLRLPARRIPHGAAAAEVADALFDDDMNRAYFERVLEKSYEPTLALLTELVDQGMTIGLGMSGSLRRQAEAWAPTWLHRWDALVARPGVEAVVMDPLHSFLFYADLPAFTAALREAAAALEARTGRRPVAADTTEMWHSPAVAAALLDAGVTLALADGRPRLLGWRQPTYLYRSEAVPALRLMTRHVELSDDVGFRYSDRTWKEWPLRVADYAAWIRESPGDYIFLAWDFETFGEHHWRESGIFDFLAALPGALETAGVRLERLSDIARALDGRAFALPLAADAVSWAGDGDPDFFLGNAPQRHMFRLMLDAYALGRRRGGVAEELGRWLLQSDHLHLLHWYGRTGSEAEVSAYFTPRAWWDLGGAGIVREMAEVYRQFIGWALEG